MRAYHGHLCKDVLPRHQVHVAGGAQGKERITEKTKSGTVLRAVLGSVLGTVFKAVHPRRRTTCCVVVAAATLFAALLSSCD